MLKFMLSCIALCFLLSNWHMIISVLLVLSFSWLVLMMNFNFGVINLMQLDNLAYLLSALSLWISALMIMMSYYMKYSGNFFTIFTGLILLMLVFLTLSFSTSNLLMFYIAFESTLIPIFMMIMGWGYQPERSVASYFLLFYTLTASLPMLLVILWINRTQMGLDFVHMSTGHSLSYLVFWGLMMAFLVKLPVYIGHLWLPKAHVEAPVAGSMILAGVLLKLGGYGFIRVTPFIEYTLSDFSSLLVSLGLVGGVLASFICIRQTDCKSLVAYSSVAHMALVLVGISLNSWLGVGGAAIIMVAHGLCSSGLFSLVGMIYERISTRSITLIRGLVGMAPLMVLWWFIFVISNMAAPPTPNLAGEVFIFMSSLSWLGATSLFVGLLSFMAGAYNLFLFVAVQHGSSSLGLKSFSDSSFREHLVLVSHMGPFMMSFLVLMHLYS
uniref:NADH dehydrogenase subunit 4 n=1 Tax=Daphnia tibetana TaxID=2172416 RepID=UPI002115663C|nr:NADH dehydrogenase subunit 4 [Daphnia tibetana]USH58532.1 NADH dehydrogenase subunit 4 [Daphnia tibetana]